MSLKTGQVQALQALADGKEKTTVEIRDLYPAPKPSLQAVHARLCALAKLGLIEQTGRQKHAKVWRSRPLGGKQGVLL